jgi:structural maintenance of chromosome 2
MDKQSSTAEAVKRKLDLRKHELAMCEERVAETTYAQLVKEIEGKEADLAGYKAAFATLSADAERAQAELQKLKDTAQNIQKQREAALKEIERSVKAAAKEATSKREACNKLKQKRDVLIGEINSYERDSDQNEKALKASQENIDRLEREVSALDENVSAVKKQYEDAKDRVQEMSSKLNSIAKEIKSLDSAASKAQKEAETASLELKKRTHTLAQFEADCAENETAIERLEESYPWIAAEKVHFGKEGGNYDFNSKGASTVENEKKRLKTLRVDQEKLSKKINKKVMGMIEKAEEDYNALQKKRDVILEDKLKIQNVMDELEIKKANALHTTWVKVNHDFGSIFSTLLPGVTSKLEPINPKDVSEGLEVKVAFNGVWKQSLTELSGGQRSLLALSLILSLLLFKPAPMYILDEVDAALDLSHTQNIGLMLKTHFSASQFIVVSLKEGMFNNANVIFRTRFVDGISQVSRTVVNSKAKGAGKSVTLAIDDAKDVSEGNTTKAGAGASKKGRGAKKSADAENTPANTVSA